MKKTWILIAVLALASAGCRDRFQRIDDPDRGYAHALECVETQGDTAARAAELCGKRGFSPGNLKYQEGWGRALECARGQKGSASEAVQACNEA